jgi:hypothetical protein
MLDISATIANTATPMTSTGLGIGPGGCTHERPLAAAGREFHLSPENRRVGLAAHS